MDYFNNLDNIISAFTAVTKRLEKFIAQRTARREKVLQEIAAKNLEVSSLDKDVARAEKIKGNIAKIIS